MTGPSCPAVRFVLLFIGIMMLSLTACKQSTFKQFKQAIEKRDIPTLKKLLDENQQEYVMDRHQTSILHTAVSQHVPQAVKIILKYGYNPLLENDNGDSAMELALQSDQQDIILVIIQFILGLTEDDPFNDDVMDMLSKLREYPELQDIKLNRMIEDRRMEQTEEYQLLKAVQNHDRVMIKALVEENVTVNVRSMDGRTPLQIAMDNGDDEIVEYLIQHGADIENPDYGDKSAIDRAIDTGSTGWVVMMIDENPSILNHQELRQRLQSMNAPEINQRLLQSQNKAISSRPERDVSGTSYHGEKETRSNMIVNVETGSGTGEAEKNKPVDKKTQIIVNTAQSEPINTEENDRGETELTEAIKQHDRQKVLILIRRNINLNQRNRYGLTPLMVSVIQGWNDVVDLLIEHGAALDLKNKNGQTALMFAVYMDRYGAAKRLVDAGASRFIRDRFGKTAFDYARLKNNPRMMELVGESQ